jgi:hypothetical protein
MDVLVDSITSSQIAEDGNSRDDQVWPDYMHLNENLSPFS